MKLPTKRAKLIFNPSSGTGEESQVNLLDIIHEMQVWKLVPEAFLVEPGCDLPQVIQDALAQGIRLFVVCGGDGTISAVARTLAGTKATLGIIPIGTQNNTALSLDIPENIQAAIAILRTGRRIKVDVGLVSYRNETTPFLEVCSVGLISSLFPSVDDIQHGNLARVGDFLATLTASPPAEIQILLDGKQKIQGQGHVVLVSNMPYIGFHYQVSSAGSYQDGLLDVLFFANLSKLDLVSYVFEGVGMGKPEDPRIQHFHVRKVEITTNPPMPVMADGSPLGEDESAASHGESPQEKRVQIEVWQHALAVMVAQPQTEPQQAASEKSKPQTDDENLI